MARKRSHTVQAPEFWMTPTFFPTPADFRSWLLDNHASARELWVGFHKKGSGKPSITWPQAVDQALCFGWIDGIRKSLGEDSYVIRFSPRRPDSIWSAVNIRNVEKLIGLDLMRPEGLAAFSKRTEEKSRIYAFKREHAELDAASRKRFEENARAWAFFRSQPPGYRKVASWWVVSAKREATREKRLTTLIEDSAAGRRLGSPRKER